MHVFIAGLGLTLLLAALPGLVELTLLTLLSLRRSRPGPGLAPDSARTCAVTVVIPAHNEQANLLPTLRSVQASVARARAGDGLPHRIVVIADNCSDNTADIARGAGVDVLERQDSSARGKGFALNFAFTALADDASAGFVVIDADTRVPENFIGRAAVAFAAGLPAFQASYRVLNFDDNLRTRWMQLALTGFNHLRLIARARLGLSVGILGNGFGLSKRTLQLVPYDAGSVVEDLEYHLRLVAAGVRVHHLADAEVRAEMPVAAEAAGTQRARWEGGRVQMIRAHSLPLLLAVLRGRLRLLEPLLELWLLPLAWQLLLFAALALWPWPPGRYAGLLGLAVIALHVLSAARQSDVPGIFAVLLRLPLYVLWKLARLGGILRLAGNRDAAWERTRRIAEDAPVDTGSAAFDLSLVLVSFNTKHLLDECLGTIARNRGDLRVQVIVVDNASRDGSAEHIARHHPEVELVCSDANLGFGPANNVGFARVRGKYTVLLNTDAFLADGVLANAFRIMEATPDIGLLGALLIGRDDVLQPSARLFPSLLNDFLILSGLAWHFPRSRLFGRADRTWADPHAAADVDWVPGAFSVIRTDLLRRIGGFDTRFFLYYEEVDLCRRIRAEGLRIHYEPALRVVHIGGESSKSIKRLSFSSSGNQLTLWRMRSGLMYYRKHHGRLGAWLIAQMELRWHQLRALKPGQEPARREESQVICTLMRTAWQETDGGRHSPPQPW